MDDSGELTTSCSGMGRMELTHGVGGEMRGVELLATSASTCRLKSSVTPLWLMSCMRQVVTPPDT